jgi:DNA polymerase-1
MKTEKTGNGILAILDGNALVHRAYHALPPLTNGDGQATGAVYGVAMTLLSVLEKFHPEYVVASFDLAAPTFRHEAYAEYKATRKKAPDDLYEQIPIVKDLVRAFNIPIYEKEGFEADDCVGTLARQASELGIPTVIVTGDNDALQLVSPLVKVFALRKGVKDIALYDEAAVMEKYGFTPSVIPDYKGLAGDNSDNIPGVSGIGVKTATDLLREFGSLERIYESIDSVKESVRRKLDSGRQSAFLSKELGTIDVSVPIVFDRDAARTKDFDRTLVTDFFRRMGFYSLIGRIPGGSGAESEVFWATGKPDVSRKKRQKTVGTSEEFGLFLVGTTDMPVGARIVFREGSLFGDGVIGAVELASEFGAITVEWNHSTKPVFATFFSDSGKRKVFHDAKAAWHILRREGIDLVGVSFDTMLSGYLLLAGTRIELDRLLSEEFGDESFPNSAAAILRLSARLQEKMDAVSREQTGEWTLSRLFKEVEMPLFPILARMEESGIRLDTDIFRRLSEGLSEELSRIERKIYDLAGREFNINSPKQLSEVLFADLNLPTKGIKRTKTGISTASSELEKLREYPIVSLIEEERELFKLKTTYLDAFPARVDAGSRLHTTFQQAVTATGRLSSSDPNLQNIPASERWNRAIRGAFVAEDGHLLVGLDYSQIELRVMAHVSGDAELRRAFLSGEDVHRAAAALVFGVSPDSVTPDMRRQAKVFNFGIMYGMSAYGLSQRLGIPIDEASVFISNYFERFEGVARFMESMKVSARERGFVETELGRRRYVPEILSANRSVASSGERMAVNMPIQGLAADIMKLAMLRVSDAISEYGESARAILQVHDELVFEVEEDIAVPFVERMKEIMEHSYQISVPLVVEAGIGRDWGRLK